MRGWPRFFALALLCVGVLLVSLYLLTRGDRRADRRGIRIETTTIELDDSSVHPSLLQEGWPIPRSIDEPRFLHYAKRTADGKVHLYRRLSFRKVDLAEINAEEVELLIYPAPDTLEVTEDPQQSPPEPEISVSANRAKVSQEWFGAPATESGQGSDREAWRLVLDGDVLAVSRKDGRRIELRATDLDCLLEKGEGQEGTRERIRTRGLVDVVADEFKVRGEGLDGQLALGEISLARNVEVSLPTSSILGESGSGAETEIKCRGPFHVKRYEEGEGKNKRVFSLISFSDQVSIVQGATPTEARKTLSAGKLELLLEILEPPPTEEGSGTKEDAGLAPPIELIRLTASDGVDLKSEDGTRVRAGSIEVTREPDAERIELKERILLKHAGDLAEIFGSKEEVRGVLVVTAGDSATLVKTKSTKEANAIFRGAVNAERQNSTGEPLLSLKAEELRIHSAPGKGEEMTAKGSARFSTPTSEGSADAISWTRTADGEERIELNGRPRVMARGGVGFNPFAAGEAPEAPPAGDTAPDSVVVITSEESMKLTSRGEVREILIGKRTVITKTTDGKEVFRVEANGARALLLGELVQEVVAKGNVNATGSGEGAVTGTFQATGDEFRFEDATGTAVLTGAPAIARMRETPEKENLIEARRLTFSTKENRFVAETAVQARIFLEESGRRGTQPFILHCDRLLVEPSEGELAEDASPAARISSLLAEGNLSLSGRNATAHGDRLSYRGGETEQKITLTGGPAKLTQVVKVGETSYTDHYESREFSLGLKDRDISLFRAPSGGSFVLHRPFDSDSPSLLGPGTPGSTGATVERLSGGCEGPLTYDTVLATMSDKAWLEQAQGSVSGFRRVARFDANRIEARRGIGLNGEYQLIGAAGRGNVRATGDGWKLTCDSFEVDLLKHLTQVRGNPARLTRDGAEQLVGYAAYDYVKDEWKVHRMRVRPR